MTEKTISRRTLVKTGVGALAAPAVLRVVSANAQSQVIKIGHVSPKTGPLAGFGEADGWKKKRKDTHEHDHRHLLPHLP